ncbi:MAG: dTDP-4-amino-4,6-dideoxygalactose transaminase [Steroidobacteraceae bacterium]
MQIPFNKPYPSGKEISYIAQAIAAGRLSGDGDFSRRCEHWLEGTLNSVKALLTHSCTAALEMAAILCELEVGDEVIMPAFTHPSTANAVVLRGATPVFVDVRFDTFNIDESLIEPAITSRTKAIIVVHYAGVGCEMDPIMDVARRHNLRVVEDAAQGILTRYKGRYLGTLGDIGALSFHETKNAIAGEGGAILINSPRYVERAEIIREKGTSRAQFFRGEIDKYAWIDMGSSYLPGEIVAAFLLAQLEKIHELTGRRKDIWSRYHQGLEDLELAGFLKRPVIPPSCDHNGHLYYLVMPNPNARSKLIAELRKREISAPFHYVPLHTSPAGLRFGRTHDRLPITERAGECLVRLPIWLGIEPHLDRIIGEVSSIMRQ